MILAASTIPTIWAEAQVASDTLKKIGFNTDFQALEWGTVVQRRASKEPIDKGGWNIFYTYLGGFGNITPAPAIPIQSSGTNGSWFGWPTDPKMEELRAAWFDAPDVAAQKKICEADAGRVLAEPALRATRHCTTSRRRFTATCRTFATAGRGLRSEEKRIHPGGAAWAP